MGLPISHFFAYTPFIQHRSERGNRTPFRYLPECASGGAELVDYDLSKRQRVYGVARVAGDPLLFAVKYRHAVSLMDAEGDMKGHWKSVGKVLPFRLLFP